MESSTSLTFYQILSASAKSRTHYYPDFLAQLLGNFFFSTILGHFQTLWRLINQVGTATHTPEIGNFGNG